MQVGCRWDPNVTVGIDKHLTLHAEIFHQVPESDSTTFPVTHSQKDVDTLVDADYTLTIGGEA